MLRERIVLGAWLLLATALSISPTLHAKDSNKADLVKRTSSWELSQSIRGATELVTCGAGVLSGAFDLNAEIQLALLDGTGASVMLGDGINFGFDSRDGQLFIEGSEIGDKPIFLGPNRDHIAAGKPFQFTAHRGADGAVKISINGRKIHELAKTPDALGMIAFRPHRNQIDIISASLVGDLEKLDHVTRPFVVIHKQGDHDCHTFRIPGLAKTNAGTLLAVYDMRYDSRRDLQGHMDIGLSRSTDGGKTWEAPTPIMDMGEHGGLPENQNGCSDANILVDTKTGEIFVSACWTHGKPGTHQWVRDGSEPGHAIGKSTQFMVVRSKDDGITWSKPENWTKRLKDPKWYLFAPAPGNGICLPDGSLVIPTQGRDENGVPFSNIITSRDHGRTWNVSNAARSNTTECAVAMLPNGQLMLNMRDNRNRGDKSATNGRAISTTRDRGKTWKIHSTDHGALPEPVCMASLISHRTSRGQDLLIFSNPNSKTQRKYMTIKLSIDAGETWPTDLQILLDAAGGAYSSLVMINPETIGILYESSRADLVFQSVRLSEFGIEP